MHTVVSTKNKRIKKALLPCEHKNKSIKKRINNSTQQTRNKKALAPEKQRQHNKKAQHKTRKRAHAQKKSACEKNAFFQHIKKAHRQKRHKTQKSIKKSVSGQHIVLDMCLPAQKSAGQ